MASSATQRSIQFNISAAGSPEAKSSNASVANVSLFSKNSLAILCMEKLLSEEHRLGNLGHQLPPLWSDRYTQFKQEKLKLLLEAILRGDPETTIQMSSAYPILLLEKLNENDFITAPSGHKASATPYRLALAVEDTQMATLLKAELIKVAGEQEAVDQLTEQFPTGWQEEEEKKSAPIFAQLDTLTLAIRYAQAGDITSSGTLFGDTDYRVKVRQGSVVAIALARFRSLLDATLEEVVTTGRLFNPNLLLRAFEIYDKPYAKNFEVGYRNPKSMLLWQQVFGYVQRFMPANYAQAFCEDIGNTNKKLQESTPQGRSLKFNKYYAGLWGTRDFYPPFSRLGFDFAICAAGDASWGEMRAWAGGLSALVSIKNSSLTELLAQQQDCRCGVSKSCCLVM